MEARNQAQSAESEAQIMKKKRRLTQCCTRTGVECHADRWVKQVFSYAKIDATIV